MVKNQGKTDKSTLLKIVVFFRKVRVFSFLFCFMLFSVKIVSTQLPEKWKMLIQSVFAGKHRPHFELPENSVPRLHKAQYRN